MQAIRLPTDRDRITPNGTILGWGQQRSGGILSITLRSLDQAIITNASQCRNLITRPHFDRNKICSFAGAGSGNLAK